MRHYALTNHKEFFAEMSEAYFGMNDFFPFNRGTQGKRTRNLRPDADRVGSYCARPMTGRSDDHRLFEYCQRDELELAAQMDATDEGRGVRNWSCGWQRPNMAFSLSNAPRRKPKTSSAF